MKYLKKYWLGIAIFTLIGCSMISCSKKDAGNSVSLPNPLFTVSKLADNTIIVKNTTQGSYSSLSWNFGNGITSIKEIDTVNYNEKGEYTIKLTLTNKGGSASTTRIIKINDEKDDEGVNLTPSFTATPLSGNPNKIAVKSTTQDATSWSWGFGNGTTSTKEKDTIFYKKAGTYTITLTAMGQGDTVSTTKDITIDNGVVEKPKPSFTAAPLSGEPNKIVIENTTSGTISSILWNFGNGTTSSKEKDTVLYTKAGTYTIILTVSNSGGSDSITQNVSIKNDATGLDLVNGGGMTLADESSWTVITQNDDMPVIKFTSEGVTITDNEDTASANSAIYQTINVEAGMRYKFSAHVKGNGMKGAWINVFMLKQEPKGGNKYAGDDDAFTELNAWSGCGKTPFDGDIVELSCVGPAKDNHGEITFDESGTIYLLLMVGNSQKPTNSYTLGDGGVTISEVKLVIQ